MVFLRPALPPEPHQQPKYHPNPRFEGGEAKVARHKQRSKEQETMSEGYVYLKEARMEATVQEGWGGAIISESHPNPHKVLCQGGPFFFHRSGG